MTGRRRRRGEREKCAEAKEWGPSTESSYRARACCCAGGKRERWSVGSVGSGETGGACHSGRATGQKATMRAGRYQGSVPGKGGGHVGHRRAAGAAAGPEETERHRPRVDDPPRQLGVGAALRQQNGGGGGAVGQRSLAAALKAAGPRRRGIIAESTLNTMQYPIKKKQEKTTGPLSQGGQPRRPTAVAARAHGWHPCGNDRGEGSRIVGPIDTRATITAGNL